MIEQVFGIATEDNTAYSREEVLIVRNDDGELEEVVLYERAEQRK